jgi:hypothetical protein
VRNWPYEFVTAHMPPKRALMSMATMRVGLRPCLSASEPHTQPPIIIPMKTLDVIKPCSVRERMCDDMNCRLPLKCSYLSETRFKSAGMVMSLM